MCLVCVGGRCVWCVCVYVCLVNRRVCGVCALYYDAEYIFTISCCDCLPPPPADRPCVIPLDQAVPSFRSLRSSRSSTAAEMEWVTGRQIFMAVGLLRGVTVAIRKVGNASITLTNDDLLELKEVRHKGPLRVMVNIAPLRVMVNKSPLRVMVNKVPLRVMVNKSPLRVMVNKVPLRVMVNKVPLRVMVNKGPLRVTVNKGSPQSNGKQSPLRVMVNKSPLRVMVNKVPLRVMVNKVPLRVMVNKGPLRVMVNKAPSE